MTPWNNKTVKIPLWGVFLAVLILVAALLLIFFFAAEGVKSQALAGGLLGGLIVYIGEHITRVSVFEELEEHKEMGFRRLLRNRHDKNYYGEILKRANKSVMVMGTSCSRFIRDFLDRDSQEHVLVKRLRDQPDLKVFLLVPKEELMDERSHNALQSVLGQVQSAKREFRERLQIRRFDGEARHSIVIVDDQLIAGPVFDSDKSSYEPAVHVLLESGLGGKYEEYFRLQWDNALDDESIDRND